ncbi:hypothetical protein EOD41_11035 [Mucilaginibacter limnophilus]|uniref:Acetyl xylan esterase domain-containing protein n=1 Tax=Mucilaginibacter limnophilus TaxID=1932778 RepID=A0A437MSA3_9SPHI|nr:acetylxylan esterase [Mucilaginibacter limnophilus]RVU00530.1 hypothetical protein EOD41_11035 [Mucilaginibacter limnophilus]
MFKLKYILALFFCCLVVKGYAQHEEEEEAAETNQPEFIFEASPLKKEAIYKSGDKIGYDIKVVNTYDVVQEGTLSFLVTTMKNQQVSQNSMKVNIGKKSTAKFSIKVPNNNTAGFYKIQIMLNVTEYDDTLRKVFGINTNELKSNTPAPPDFNDFWANARAELQNIKPNFKMTEQPDLEQNGISVYLIETKSLNNLTVRGWLTLPKKRKPNKKLPVWLVLPGYGGTGVKPIFGSDDLAVLAFNVRGQGNSRDVVHPTREGYLTTDIENKNRYILRGAIMDCIRSVDFICSRPELDSTNIICSGGSMGGYFSIVTCSLDSRIKLCSANNPVFCDYRALEGSADWPMSSFARYSKERFVPLKKIFDNLDYYDLKNFAVNLRTRALLAVSLLDNLAPPTNEFVMLNSIKQAEYKLFVYPDLAHEVPPPLFAYLSNWMMDEFGIF